MLAYSAAKGLEAAGIVDKKGLHARRMRTTTTGRETTVRDIPFFAPVEEATTPTRSTTQPLNNGYCLID
jgi:hypothetical protein